MGWIKKTKMLRKKACGASRPSSAQRMPETPTEQRPKEVKLPSSSSSSSSQPTSSSVECDDYGLGLRYRSISTSAAAVAVRRNSLPEGRPVTNFSPPSCCLLPKSTLQHHHRHHQVRSLSAPTAQPTTTTASNPRKIITSTRQSFEIKQDALTHQPFLPPPLHNNHNTTTEEQIFRDSRQNFWIRMAAQVSPSDTSQKELIHRSSFIIISTMTVGAGIIWALMYVALEEYLAALMPIIYSIVMGIVLVISIHRERVVAPSAKSSTTNTSTIAGDTEIGCYDYLATAQLVMILLLPFAVHVALGGVEKSGGVMLWSFLCPMGAAFFRSSAESLRYFGVYLCISIVLLTIDFNDQDLDRVHLLTTNQDAHLDGGEFDRSASSTSSSHRSKRVQSLYFLMNILGVKCVIFAAVFLFARELEKEYTKSENVLLNILPRSIVKRIKQGELPIVDHVPDVTILFADLVGFTKASAELHPNFLIGLFLRDIFQELDELVYKHGLEKIKTIGDAYMVVGGLNHGERLSNHSCSQSAEYRSQKPQATNIMLFAVDMFKALRNVNRRHSLSFDLRVGIHTGPVVAGVLGLKRFAYDVWGDTVNIASRMESNGVPGLIHLSSDMYESVGNMTSIFDFTCCGEISVKGKGVMTTYLAMTLDKDDNEMFEEAMSTTMLRTEKVDV